MEVSTFLAWNRRDRLDIPPPFLIILWLSALSPFEADAFSYERGLEPLKNVHPTTFDGLGVLL